MKEMNINQVSYSIAVKTILSQNKINELKLKLLIINGINTIINVTTNKPILIPPQPRLFKDSMFGTKSIKQIPYNDYVYNIYNILKEYNQKIID